MTNARGRRFVYERFEVDPSAGQVRSHYSLDGRPFTEVVTLSPSLDWQGHAVAAAGRLLFLLSGVSYYKTAAPPLVDLGSTPVTARELEFLREFYLDGLAEFAYVNSLDLRADFELEGGAVGEVEPVPWRGSVERPLVPFGGGIDSIVVAEQLKHRFDDVSLFVAGRFTAIENAAAVTGLPILRAQRQIDSQVLRSSELGFLNGHIPVTGVLSAIAVMAAILDHRTAVVMSNERSASVGTLEHNGRWINHQYSKSLDFERSFRLLVNDALPGMKYFSALRPYSELWVAERFAKLAEYHPVFRSCNRAFYLDPTKRAQSWCAQCDKCCFIDLILSPFMTPGELSAVFNGREPLTNPELLGQFRSLLGDTLESKPFECVGDVTECQAAVLLTSQRADRAGSAVLETLRQKVLHDLGAQRIDPAQLRSAMGPHFIERSYAVDDLLV